MTTLVIGGDRIESLRRDLARYGLNDVEHWGGRKPADARRPIPPRVELVVVVTDQLNHAMLHNVTLRATRLDLPIVYTRRSGHELRARLGERFGIPDAAPPATGRDWLNRYGFSGISY
ncbi:MAG: DUF2325 domain-containing protein [Methylobacterium sp.]|nr:DUF2325 domain-containing protein [Methylobacterium sp.]